MLGKFSSISPLFLASRPFYGHFSIMHLFGFWEKEKNKIISIDLGDLLHVKAWPVSIHFGSE